MDFELELLIARTTILNTRERIKNSLYEIEKTAPDRIEYINPMKNTIERLLHAHFVYDNLEKEFRIARQRASNLEYKLLILWQENEKLKKEIKDYKTIFEIGENKDQQNAEM
jgi:hypothetical protein